MERTVAGAQQTQWMDTVKMAERAIDTPAPRDLDKAVKSPHPLLTWPGNSSRSTSLSSLQKESINPIRQRCDMAKTITRDELREKIDRGDSFMLLETLAPTAYQHAHLPGAINMPPDQVTQLAAKLLPDKQADIVVYCASPT
jgi:hypothetical protein